ncbi:vacuolar proton translocating ATPase 100 kDa subunit [Thecamonas trahens ATCC 50062]|uniref:V-type proton ATPase subunit a n=1 Tax=Thecamonas trahens ATCC 50062 TaxID=461836 RepID=A0A0L0DKR7_THETB|nr:vacuolar proton translocating ATPase 100 kDa subunit [Thecamonas trahens ATCC 50062]KNC52902.1 vacuolar proton translocating ATPase 100 kDa subunit [Thecamonas trahens ATCC 50062]|eukprot:XP_013754996.1 vacuolar proton translocating ATPase 100 kDa subunit [Thecamonas trahens ATCC 50062]
MGSLFRSEEMHLIEMVVQAEAAHATVEELGRTGVVQFVDLNPELNAFQRSYVNDVKRCDELERKLRFFKEQVEKAGLPIAPKTEAGAAATEASSLVQGARRGRRYGGAGAGMAAPADAGGANLDDLEEHFVELEAGLVQLNANQEILDSAANELTELQCLLAQTSVFFDDAGAAGDVFVSQTSALDANGPSASSPLLGTGGRLGESAPGAGTASSRAVQLGYVSGLLEQTKMARFERLLWRATRGNHILRQCTEAVELSDPASGEPVSKIAFIVFFQGARLRTKITKMCESYGANLYETPDTASARQQLLVEVEARMDDLELTLDSAAEQRERVLSVIAASLEDWLDIVNREQRIYHALNLWKSDVSSRALVARAWAPVWGDSQIEAALARGVARSGASVQSFFEVKVTSSPPPTYFVTNKYTAGFQALMDAYGMARYQEANAGVFTIITFPFLFAVMFGDLGHGALLTMFAAILVAYEGRIARIPGRPEMFNMLFNGRYLILAMGVFAMYAGLLYNDCFGFSIDFFGSNWSRPSDGDAHLIDPDRVYPFGVDPGWAGATNKLQFYNSFKMKTAIIYGVTQMLFGVVLSLTNHLYYGNYIDVWTRFIPEVLFLGGMFGYMVILIIYKWVTVIPDPPLILTVMIDMFLKAGSVPAKDEMYSGQGAVQIILVFVLLVAIPWLLLPKPIILWMRKKAAARRAGHSHGGATEALLAPAADGTEPEGDGHGHDMGEIVIHQIIHTIEYVLGTVSNTASYLRLWALSLAHAELSEVILDQVLFRGLKAGSAPLIFAAFTVWALATVGILMIMESLSAFLHALRLHWVEFLSKFGASDGWKFEPFNLDAPVAAE